MDKSEIISLIRTYAEENMRLMGDGILHDPLLHGEPWTEENVKRSDDCSVDSLIHSSKYHAAKDILALIGEPADDI